MIFIPTIFYICTEVELKRWGMKPFLFGIQFSMTFMPITFFYYCSEWLLYQSHFFYTSVKDFNFWYETFPFRYNSDDFYTNHLYFFTEVTEVHFRYKTPPFRYTILHDFHTDHLDFNTEVKELNLWYETFPFPYTSLVTFIPITFNCIPK